MVTEPTTAATVRYDHYDIFGDDPIVKCRRCGDWAAIDTLADAVSWAEGHEPTCDHDDV